MTYSPTWVATDGLLSPRQLNANDATSSWVTGEEVQAKEPVLGSGRFEYVCALTAVAAGQVVEFVSAADPNTTTIMCAGVQPWGGTANSGRALGVAPYAISLNQYGFVQVEGMAAVNVSGTVAAGDPANYASSGTFKSASATTKQALGVVAATANGATVGAMVLSSTQAVYDLDYMHAESAA